MELIHGDCLKEMPRLIERGIKVDAVICDPPYSATQNKWDSVIDIESMWINLNKLSRDKSAIVIMAAQPFSSAIVMSNVENFSYQWIWVKSKITGVLNAKKMPVRKHEQILVFSNRPSKSTSIYNAQGLLPKNSITKQGRSSENYGNRNKSEYLQKWTNWPRDVIEIKSEGKTVHPTQKPVALMEYLVKTYTNEGDTVLDFAMGSGTTGLACKNTNREFIGIEMDETYFKIAQERIGQ